MSLQSEIKFAAIILAGALPMMTFLSIVMDVSMYEDYGLWGLFGFVGCMIFYAECAKKAESVKDKERGWNGTKPGLRQ